MTFNFVRGTTADHSLLMLFFLCIWFLFPYHRVNVITIRRLAGPKDINIVFTFCDSNRRHCWIMQSPVCHYFVNYTFICFEMTAMVLYCLKTDLNSPCVQSTFSSVLFSASFTWNGVNWVQQILQLKQENSRKSLIARTAINLAIEFLKRTMWCPI